METIFSFSKGFLSREIQLFWLFTKRDLPTTVLPASSFMLVALLSSNSDITAETVSLFCLGIIYFALYIYPFDILNQIHGINEDKIDKPDRPLPQGLLTINEAYIRYGVLTAAFLALGAILGVLSWTILWILVTYQLNARGWDKNWFTKNFVSMGLGTVAQLGAAWTIMAPATLESYILVFCIAFWVGVTSSTQDFRDVKGDKESGRSTLPILMGDQPARKVMTGVWIGMAIFMLSIFLWLGGGIANMTTVFAIELAVLFVWHLTIASRLWWLRSAKNDRATYLAHSYLYCMILITSFFLF